MSISDSQESLVTIITPSYNSARFIGETIKSVLNQSYSNWEMIIVDDCSSDDTVKIVEKYSKKDGRIHLIKLENNSGAAVARNTAISKAKGRYIAFLDSDDIWKPNKLSEQIKFMQTNDYAFTFTSYEIMDVAGNFTSKSVHAVKEVDYTHLLKSPGAIGCLTVILDRDKIKDCKMPNIKTRQDFALWLKILKAGINAYGLKLSLSQYRIVPGSISSNKIKAAKKNWFVYRNIEGLGIIKSSWYFTNYAIRAVIKTYL
ncbi:glycosyltransferase family 2 protein [Aquibacillus kalidii]|uniref:glycosyltransferase family 2 protein n=1 Tax=Aquibacillus kalidii TaxID=2762597 RepID=UPI0038B406B3